MLALLSGFALLLCGARAGGPDEYEVMAGFLYNFAHYTSWPADAFKDTEDARAPIVFGILGTDPFEDYLDTIADKYTITNRKLVIRRWDDLKELGDCHVLFVGRSMQKDSKAIIKALQKRPVFTVSERYDFTREGGVARMFVDASKIKFEINIDAAARAKLSISSQLLKLALVIHDEDLPPGNGVPADLQRGDGDGR